MHQFLNKYTHTFIIDGVKTVLDTPPINEGEIERTITRSEKSNSIALDVLQDVEFVKEARKTVLAQQDLKGSGGTFKYILQEDVNGTDETVYEGFIDLSTIKETKTTAKCSFRSNEIDARFRNNITQSFELDRTTDIDGNILPILETKTMLYKLRKIFLRSELELRESKLYFETGIYAGACPTLTKTISSDPNIGGVFQNTAGHVGVFGGFDPPSPQEAQFFYFNNDRERTLQIRFDVDFDWKFNNNGIVDGYGDPVTISIRVVKMNYDEITQDLTYIEEIIVEEFTRTGDQVHNITYTSPVDGNYTLQLGDCLCAMVYENNGVAGYTFTPYKWNMFIEEDSFYEPDLEEEMYIEGITLYDAFERVCMIMGHDIGFKSDHITNKWKNVFLASGENLRHVLFEGDKPPILTTSFEELYDFAFYIDPVGYDIVINGKDKYIEVEDIANYYDNSETIDLGEVEVVSETTNIKKVFKKIMLGGTESGTNEEISGIFVTNAVTEYGLPITDLGEVYDATHRYITDCNESEIQFRLQYSRNPDLDAKRDGNVFAYNCNYNSTSDLYIVRESTEDFDSIDGVYSPETTYNLVWTPLNCLLRHGKNFRQEFFADVYDGKGTDFFTSVGNTELITEVLGGDPLKESDSVLLTALDSAMYSAKAVEVNMAYNREVVKKLLHGTDKKGYHKQVSYIEDGITTLAFVDKIKIDNEMKLNLIKING